MVTHCRSYAEHNHLCKWYCAIVDSFRGFSVTAFDLCSTVKQESRFWLLADTFVCPRGAELLV